MAPSRAAAETAERLRRRFGAATRSTPGSGAGGGRRSPLVETAEFGSNPGGLKMLSYAPKDLAARAPLVVVLHGCSQNAAGYDAAAGWTALADERGFAVLYPEQRQSNNPGGCFNWFLAADKSRGLGESRSIHEMIDTMANRHRIDRSRIFVTGLSAGGAMAAALLADYPELFAAGSILAGLPCGAAASMQEALGAMSRPADRTAEQLGDAVRAEARHAGSWPRVQIWHGSADATVVPRNADDLVKQWLNVHGAPAKDFREETLPNARRRVWTLGGEAVVEQIMIAGMGHGAPLDGRMTGEAKAPYMLDVGISSTRKSAAFFGIAEAQGKEQPTADTQAAPAPAATAPERPKAVAAMEGEVLPPEPKPARASSSATGSNGRSNGAGERERPSGTAGRFDIGAVINKALRSAGLMK